jgi:hypothetical protein
MKSEENEKLSVRNFQHDTNRFYSFLQDSENFKKEQVGKYARNSILENVNLEMFQRTKAFNFEMQLDELKSNLLPKQKFRALLGTTEQYQLT